MSDLHALLDSLTDGEHVKATWTYGGCTVVTEGPVSVARSGVWCVRRIRWADGEIDRTLTSLEVTRDEGGEVTVTRDGEDALHALLDSLEDGQEVTAEWRNRDGSMTLTGAARSSGSLRGVYGYIYSALRLREGVLHSDLHSVTVRRPVVQRWEREGND